MNLNLQGSAKKSGIEQHTMTESLKRDSPLGLSLDAQGCICGCDKFTETIFGYQPHDLLWQHISCLFPTLAEVPLMQGNQLNPMLNYICHCDHYFEVVNKQGDINVCNLNFILVENKGIPNLRLIVRPLSRS